MKSLIAFGLIPILMGLIMAILITGRYSKDIKRLEKTDVKSEIIEDNYNFTYENEITVYVTQYGTKYHLDNCFYTKNNCEILNLSEDKQRGYKPCSYCCK